MKKIRRMLYNLKIKLSQLKNEFPYRLAYRLETIACKILIWVENKKYGSNKCYKEICSNNDLAGVKPLSLDAYRSFVNAYHVFVFTPRELYKLNIQKLRNDMSNDWQRERMNVLAGTVKPTVVATDMSLNSPYYQIPSSGMFPSTGNSVFPIASNIPSIEDLLEQKKDDKKLQPISETGGKYYMSEDGYKLVPVFPRNITKTSKDEK